VVADLMTGVQEGDAVAMIGELADPFLSRLPSTVRRKVPELDNATTSGVEFTNDYRPVSWVGF